MKAIRALIDTNIIIDMIIKREPFVEASQQIYDLAGEGEIKGYLCATTFTNFQYILRRLLGPSVTLRHIRTLLSAFAVAPVDQAILTAAANNGMKDFEDAVICESAKRVKAKYIITRDSKDFAHCGIPALTPAEFLVLPR